MNAPGPDALLRELCIDRVLGLSDEGDERELERLLAARCARGDGSDESERFDLAGLEEDLASYELAAAAAHLALLSAPFEPLPETVRRRVTVDALTHLPKHDDPSAPRR